MERSVTTTGLIYKRFCDDPSVWNESPEAKDQSWYLEEDVLIVDGDEDADGEMLYQRYGENFARLPDDAKVEIAGGYFQWQGKGPNPETRGSLIREFKKWEKAQSTVVMSVVFELPKDLDVEKVRALREAVQALGGTINNDPFPKAKGPKPA